MDIRDTSKGALIAAVAGAVLIISLFLAWVGTGVDVSVPSGVSNIPGASQAAQQLSDAANATASGWEANNSLDIYLFIVGVFAIVPAILDLAGSDAEIPYASAGVGFLLSVIGLICLLAAMFIGFHGDREIGMWLALAALIGCCVGQYMAMQDEAAELEY